MKYSEFRTNALAELGRNSTTVIDLLDSWTNGVIRSASRKNNLWLARKRWERDITEAKRSYALPDLIATPDSFLCLTQDGISWWEVQVRGEREMTMRFSPDSTGTPKFAVVNKNAVDMWPMPDTTYTLRALVKAYEDPLDQANAAGQESALINEAYTFVMSGVLAEGFRYLKQYAAAKEWDAKHNMEAQDLRRQNSTRVLGQETSIWPSSHGMGAEYR